jgi:cytochrome c553
MKARTLAALAGGILIAATTAAPAGDPAAGEKKIATCTACHGKTGKAIMPEYPNLCGQNEKYLVDSLTQYKSGARRNPLMQPMVAGLSEADVKNISAWYASQRCD